MILYSTQSLNSKNIYSFKSTWPFNAVLEIKANSSYIGRNIYKVRIIFIFEQFIVCKQSNKTYIYIAAITIKVILFNSLFQLIRPCVNFNTNTKHEFTQGTMSIQSLLVNTTIEQIHTILFSIQFPDIPREIERYKYFT